MTLPTVVHFQEDYYLDKIAGTRLQRHTEMHVFIFPGSPQQFPTLAATSTSADSADLTEVATTVIPSLDIVTTYNIINSEPIPPPLTSLSSLTTFTTSSSTLESMLNEPVMSVANSDTVDHSDL